MTSFDDRKFARSVERVRQRTNMSEQNPYINNPLNGVSLQTILDELIRHYGFDILHAYLNINCFKSNPSLAGSLKFLKKTDWARQKVEVFYLYQYKNLPAVSSEQFKLPPRERIVPAHHQARAPAVLSVEEGQRLQAKQAKSAANWNSKTGERKGSSREYNEKRNLRSYKPTDDSGDDSGERKPARVNPWANFKGGKS